MNTTKRQSETKQLHRIGILGGTFDPIHHGHIFPAIETAQWLGLECLHLVPAHIPPHKHNTTANAQQRKAMVELVCQQFPILKLDTRELARTKASYTVDTLTELKQEQPHSQLFFVMGMDSLLSFTTWHQWQTILELCHIVVNVRPGYQPVDLHTPSMKELSAHFVETLAQLHHLTSGKIIFHQQQALDISSTEIRDEISKNIFDNNKLPSNIISYIKQQQLYL
ncbi:nicotinate-nucleotide adenylyltransferase [Thalassotalea sp. G2M2-11]|uniref:nicotinate-nucleotide adenylyltransferase n=1 Tax=Thalassotalea sp. G2M2-11 TaxID=2787627 RepID=UPI0019D2DB9E|nr:nicotinate-nucleotide adenylyltransferase [Thalassotalea sp. G2M2-11]